MLQKYYKYLGSRGTSPGEVPQQARDPRARTNTRLSIYTRTERAGSCAIYAYTQAASCELDVIHPNQLLDSK